MEELKLYSPDCPAIKNLIATFDINDIPKEVRDAAYKSYRQDYLLSQHDYEPDMDAMSIITEAKHHRTTWTSGYVTPVKDAVDRLCNDLSALSAEQFRTVKHNGIESVKILEIPDFWIEPVTAWIPDVDINMDIIDDKMEECGYVRVRTTLLREDVNDRKWFFVTYNPNPEFMPDIRSALIGMQLLHYSPEFNHDDIMESGLVPSRGGRTYMYPDERVFFYVKPSLQSFTETYRKMMSGISRKIKKDDPYFSGLFRLYMLDLSQVPKENKVYYDPNADNCVYLNCHIEPEWLEWLKDGTEEF